MFRIRSSIRSVVLGTVLVGGGLLSGMAYASNSPEVHVIFKGQEIRFAEAQPVIKDGTTLVPFRKLFETLGYSVKWVDVGGTQKAVGTKDGVTIQLTINSSTAVVNNENISLSVPAQMIDGSTMVPLRFVAENSGFEVAFSDGGSDATIRIDEAGSASEPAPANSSKEQSQDQIEPYVVKGYVRDSSGNPISGAEVYADNTFSYDSNILGVTDKNGYYRLELPQFATTWKMGGRYTKTTNGKKFSFDLKPDVDQPFAGNTGAIRDFTWSDAEGYIFIYPNFWSFDDGLPQFEISDLELTLTPIGPSLGGSTGKTIVKRGGDVYDGQGVDQIPLGRYKATARWLPEGHDPIPMLIRVEGKGQYAESVEFEFKEPKGTTASNFMMELEVSLKK